MDLIMSVVNFLMSVLWGPWTPFIIIAVAIYFSIRTRFVQVRKLKEMISLLTRKKAGDEGVSSFSSFMLSAAARVGTGNIAGVAGAICFGGPGSVVWMCIASVLGASSAFIESTLAQIYKERFGNGEFRGGAAFYIYKGLKLPAVALVFSVFAYIACGFGFHLPNMASIVSSAEMSVGLPHIVPTVITAVVLALVIFGGLNRITEVTNKAVPFMAFIYIIFCIITLVMNVANIPSAIALMFNSAFNPKSFLGGMLGSAVSWEIKRGLYSNEAGLGSATVAAATSDVEHPAQEGLTQALSVYFDTLIICLIGAVTIIVTNSYNVIDGSGNMIIPNIPEIESGVLYVQTALTSNLGRIASYILFICVWFFCFTSILGMHFYGEVNICRMFKNHAKQAAVFARCVSLAAVFVGGLTYSDLAWSVGDLCLGLMALINLPSILFLGKYALRALKDYERQEKEGVERFTFDPEALGIPGTEPGLWKELSNRKK